MKQKYYLNHLQSGYFGAIQMTRVLGSSIFFPKFCHRNDNVNNTACVSCNGKIESHIIIGSNVMIYRASIVSVPVLWSDDSAILEPKLLAKKKLKSYLLCVFDNGIKIYFDLIHKQPCFFYQVC
jgi:hypothetical protein